MNKTTSVSARHTKVLLIVALVSITFVAASFYVTGLARNAPHPLDDVLIVPLAPLSIPMLFSPLFASPTWFLGLLALTVLIGVLALVRARPPRLVRVCLLAGILLLAISPLLLPLVYGTYSLPVEAEAGYEMYWLTEPQHPFASAFKEAQRVHERYGCEYYLLGWSETETLYYESACDGRTWAFDPAVDHQPREITGQLPVMDDRPIEGVRQVGNVGHYPSHPTAFPPQAMNHAITYQKVVSPQGRWVAAAIKNYYGPRDVVVLSR